MYGASVGTGVSGAGLMMFGITIGSQFLIAFAIVVLAMMLWILARNVTRRADHQRP